MRYTLAELRKIKGLTQAALAKQLGVAPSTIAQYETGKRTPNLERAREIAKFFNVGLDDINFGPIAHNLRAKRGFPDDAQATTLDATGTD